MTRHLRLSDLAHVAARLSLLGTRLAEPCNCGRDRCTLGEHLYRATRAAQPGPQAQDFQPSRAAHGGDGMATAFIDDRAGQAHDELSDAALKLWSETRTLLLLLDNWPPTRKLTDTTASADQWCAWHLSTIGTCEPRYSGDQCRWCYDFRRQHDMMPTREILEARHAGRRITATMIADVKRAQKARRQKRRRKARR